MRIVSFFLILVFVGAGCNHSKKSDVIQMEKVGGVYKVPCKINGLSLEFIFDTGASGVSLSLAEALFMVKNGYLSESDFLNTELYRIANGEISEGTKVILRKVEFGNQVLYNVEASIVHTMDAPLLLGQSVLQRLGMFSVDYSNNTLIIGGGMIGSNKISNRTNNTTITSDTTGTVTDIKSKVYKTVKIGNQWWMAENLDVDRFRNGDLIFEAKTHEEWQQAGEKEQPAWCYYDNDPTNGLEFGKLYNCYAVNDPRGLSPEGWRIPSNADWWNLIDYLRGPYIAGKKMKSTNGWLYNGNGNNTSGFTGLPGGLCDRLGDCHSLGRIGYYWSSTLTTTDSTWNRQLNYDSESVDEIYFVGHYGISVRCLRD